MAGFDPSVFAKAIEDQGLEQPSNKISNPLSNAQEKLAKERQSLISEVGTTKLPSFGDIVRDNLNVNSIQGQAAEIAGLNVYGSVDLNYDPIDDLKDDFFSNLTDDEKLRIAENNPVNAEQTRLMAIRLEDVKRRQERMSKRPLLSTAVGLGIGLGEGLAAPTGAASILYNGAKALKLNSIAKGIAATQRTAVRRLSTGAAEGAYFGAVANKANVEKASVVDDMLINAVLNTVFGPIDYPQTRSVPNLDSSGRGFDEGKTFNQETSTDFTSGSNEPVSPSDYEVNVQAARDAHSYNSVMKEQPTNGDIYQIHADEVQRKEGLISRDEEKIENIKTQIDSLKEHKSETSELRNTLTSQTNKEFKLLSESQESFFRSSLEESELEDLPSLIRSREQSLANASQGRITAEKIRDIRSKNQLNDVFKGLDDVDISSDVDKLIAARKLQGDKLRRKEAESQIEQSIKAYDEEISFLDDKINNLEEQITSYDSKINNHRNEINDHVSESERIGKLDDIGDPFDEVYGRDMKYAAYKDGIEQQNEVFGDVSGAPIRTHTGKELVDIREAAIRNGDNDIIQTVESAEIVDGNGNRRTIGSLSEKELEDIGKDINNSSFKGDSFIQSMGQLLNETKGSTDLFRGLVSRIISNPLGNADGAVTTNAASDYVESFMQKYSTRMSRIRQDNFLSYIDRVSKGPKKLIYRQFGLSTKDYEHFIHRAGELLHEIDANPEISNQFEPEVVNYVNDFRNIIGDARQELIRNGAAEDLADDLTKSALTRVRNNKSYLSSRHAFEKDDIVNVFQGMIIKAQPAIDEINTRIGLERKLDRTTKDSSKEKIQKQIDELNDRIDEIEGTQLSDAEVMEKIRSLGDDSYSRMLGNLYYSRQLDRATKNEPINKAGVNGEDIIDAIEEANPNILSRLTEEQRSRFTEFVNNNKQSSEGGPDVFRNRINLDPSFEVKAKPTARDGLDTNDSYTIKGIDFFETDAETIGLNTLRKYSGYNGMARVGFKGVEEVQDAFTRLRKEAGKLSSRELDVTMDRIDSLEKYIKGQSQFDDFGRLNATKRTLKNLSAGSRLGFLVFSMPVELGSVIANNGIKATMQQFPNVVRSLKDIASGKSSDDFVDSLVMAGGDTLNPMFNYMSDLDNGFMESKTILKGGTDKWGNPMNVSQDVPLRYLNRAENFAATIAQGTSMTYKHVDLFNRRLAVAGTVQKLMSLPIDKLKTQRMKDIGITDEFADKIPSVEKYITRGPGGRIDKFDFDKFESDDPNFKDDFIATVIRASDKMIQTSRYANNPPLMNNQLFSWLGQFKSFALGTYNNQFKYGVRKSDSEAAALMSIQVAFAALGATARLKAEAAVTGDDQKIKDWTWKKALLAGVRNSGVFAMPTMFVDSVTGSITGKEYFSQYSVTGQTSSLLSVDSASTISMANDILSIVSDNISIAADPKRDYTQEDIRNIAAPFLPKFIVNPAARGISGFLDLEERSQRGSLDEVISIEN